MKPVSRSRGKRPGESLYISKLREMRAANKQERSSDDSESDDEDGPDTVVLHRMFHRKVVRHPDNTVVKSGKRLPLGEAEAMRVARLAGIPVPRVHYAQENPDGQSQICMDYVRGEPLDKLWPGMSKEEKKYICRQLGEILGKMRSVTPPEYLIGACDSTEIRDTRIHNTHRYSMCRDEEMFNQFLLSSLFKSTPEAMRQALSLHLRNDHRIVLTHGDLTPRNIIVQDCKIAGLIDWEDAGWYPEYWEYVNFFQRPSEGDWKQYAHDIFPMLYHEELVGYTALSRWQES